jgi:murein DD-endopeptidase MepM/ murein hydrolase activator NlpD
MKNRHFATIAALVLILAAIPLGAGAQEDKPLYIVQPGDALSRIAHDFGTTVDALIAENEISNPDLLVPGTTLVIPGFHGLSGYLIRGGEIKYGENAESLSLRYGVSQEWLARLNRWLNPERVFVGQPLILQQDGEPQGGMPTSRTFLPAAGESLLEISLRENINPWTVARTSRRADRLWVVPGNLLRLADNEESTDALPHPIAGVQIDPQILVQGHTARITLDLTGGASAEGHLGESPITFHQLEPMRLVGLQGMSAVAEPGYFDLEISLHASPESPAFYAFRQPLPLILGGYGFDPVLDVPGVTLDPATIAAEQELWGSITGVVTPERLWEGAFTYPATRTTVFPSMFGSRRNYNQLGYYNYHTGQDFYSLMGEPIPAAARGRVVFAQSLTIRGNTTLIDHGWGVFTAYLHQSQIRVEVGEMVEAGQEIGLVGNTGRVAAPHLHWEVLVGGVPVDPLEWVEMVFP